VIQPLFSEFAGIASGGIAPPRRLRIILVPGKPWPL
jgi:hypothetical protein